MIIPLNSYLIEIALLKKIFIILTQFTSDNVEIVFTENNLYFYALNESTFIWIIVDDLYGKINFLQKINFKEKTYIQLSIVSIKKILRDLLDARQGYDKFIKIGSNNNELMIKGIDTYFVSEKKILKIYNPPKVNNYNIEDPIYGNKHKYVQIVDKIMPSLLNEFYYDTMMYNEQELSIVSQKFTILARLL